MSTYETLRHFADSYALLAMMVLFVALCLWPFRPGGRLHTDRAAHSIFEEPDDGR